MPPNRNFGRSVEVDVDNDGKFFVKCHPMFSKELAKALREIADEARSLIRRRHENPPAHVRGRRSTGNLRRSVQPYKGRAAVIKQVGPTTIAGTVTAGSRRAPYARYVHEGTRRHIITPRKPGGALSFVSATRHGRKTFKRVQRELLSVAEIDAIFDTGNVDEYNAAYARRMRRLRDWKSGRQSFMRPSDLDTKLTESRQAYNPYTVVVDKVNHPGNRRSRFLVVAAHQVVAKRYGGRFNLPGGSAPVKSIRSR